VNAIAVQCKKNDNAVKVEATSTPEAQPQEDGDAGATAGVPLFLLGGRQLSTAVPPPSHTAADSVRQIQRQAPEVDKEEEGPPLIFQPKLTIGQSNDKYEQEADQIAETVMRTPDPDAMSVNEEERPLQHKGVTAPNIQTKQQTASGADESSDVAHLVPHTTGGSPLPNSVRTKVEPVLNADLSHVRVHSDEKANEAALGLDAKAFTHGNNIYLARDQSVHDVRLMAHELTHTVQQGGGQVAKKEKGVAEGEHLNGGAPNIQAKRKWYNFSIPGTDYYFDPSIEGVKNAANIAKDTVVSGVEWIVDEIKGLVDSGIDWLSDKWSTIQEFALSGFNALKNSFTDITGFIKNPFSFLADAIAGFDAGLLASAWAMFTGIVNTVWNGFKSLTGNLLQQVNKIWQKISGYAGWLLTKVSGLTENFLFKRLPGALQKIAYALIDKVNSLWKSIDAGWQKIFDTIKTWIDNALEKIERFVRRVMSYAINTLIDGIIQFGKLVLFLKDLFENPQKYISILADKSVEAFAGVEGRFASVVSQYFGGFNNTNLPPSVAGFIQKQPRTGSAAHAKCSASWGEIGSGIWEMMGKKWQEFKSNPLGIVTGLLMDMVLPVVGNVKDIIHLFKEIKKIVTGPLSAGSLDELWTSLLLILDIPILIYHTVVSILMRTLMLPLIVATFIPHPLVKGIAAAVGYALLGAFMQAEVLNIGQKLLLLKTGSTNREQKQEAYNRVADSLIAMAMTAVIMLIMLILHFIANIMKGIFNFIKGKVFGVEKGPIETKAPTEEIKSPTEEVKSPKEQTKSPKEQTKPPKEQTKPPKEEAKPPKEEAKPPKEEAKPPKEEAKPPKEETKLPKEETKPPKEETKPPKEETKPPKEEAKPPKEETKPPKEETKPPKEETSATDKDMLRERLETVRKKKLSQQEKIDAIKEDIIECDRQISELKERVKSETGKAKDSAIEQLQDALKEKKNLARELNREVDNLNKIKETEDAILRSSRLERPALRESTKRTIEDSAPKTSDGKFIDPHNPGKTIDGPWDYGHIYGREHRRLVQEAGQKGMTQAEFNDWVNSHPEWFQIEGRADNISHAYEKPGLD
jgi:hypothetical protein